MTRLLFAPKHKNPRSLALQVLLESAEKQIFAQDVLDRLLQKSLLSNQDRRLATQLIYGVIRRRATLDALLEQAVSRPKEKVETWLWEVLRSGVYQLALLKHIPPHAAIYETVELAHSLGMARAKGFINGILRKVNSLLTTDLCQLPGPDALPLEESAYRKLKEPILPDPKNQPSEYLAKGFSWPVWLARQWYSRFGWEECLRLGFWFNLPAPITLRCNTLQTDREAYLSALEAGGIRAEAGHHPQSIHLLDSVPIPQLPGFGQGWFTVQDESGMQVGSALAPQPGMMVLDLCAAPGTKTTHLAEFMANQGTIIACDVDQYRLKTLSELCNRMGVTIVKPKLLNAKAVTVPEGPFDAILVDVPCSNTGVLGRRPEVRWRLLPREISSLIHLQSRLLWKVVQKVKPGGTILYSTCSIEPGENQEMVQAVLRDFPDFQLELEKAQIPGQPSDGGYWARLRKKE